MIHYRISGGGSVREDLCLLVAVAGFEPQEIGEQYRKWGHLLEKIAAMPTIASTIPIPISTIGK